MSIEQEIQDKGLTAPRVTPSHIQSLIATEHYFNAREAALRGFQVGVVSNADLISLGLLTFCVLVLKNGFTVTGESACASPENFDEEIERKIARENAVERIWMFEGYVLKNKLHAQSSGGDHV